MRSRNRNTISSSEVHQWALSWLINSMQLKDRGPKCTATVVWNIVLRQPRNDLGVRGLSGFGERSVGHQRDGRVGGGTAQDASGSGEAVECCADGSSAAAPPASRLDSGDRLALGALLRGAERSRNEIYYGKPRQGTTKFHAYATACIVSHGVRYTLAATWVRRHETTVTALNRLLATIRAKELKIRRFLLDRAFFNVTVTRFLQEQQIPFVMPVMFRGRIPKKRRKLRGLHWIRRQNVGCYLHTLKNKKQSVTVSVYVAYRTHKNRKDGKHKQQKLLFAAWRVSGSPREIRELYRTRFGIETSYRQARQARIYTCTRDPHLRLLFVVVALLLRNVWVWIHETMLAEGYGDSMTLHQEKLRLRRMLEWIALEVVAQLHDGSKPYVDLDA